MKTKITLASLLLVVGVQAQTWNFDAAHSSVAFAIKHLAVSTTKGEFDKVDIKLSGDPKKIATLAAEVTIHTASVNTKNEKRDE
ncbi:MAG: YceI family protein, partial [Fibrobacterota bacterium]